MEAVAVLNVTILTITSYQYLQAIPAYEAGIEYVRRKYRNLTFNYDFICRSEYMGCDNLGDSIVDLAAEYYYRRPVDSGILLFTAPLCGNELLQFSPLAKEWNIPAMSIPIHNTVIELALKRIFLPYNWTTIYVMCDDNNFVSFYLVVCRNFQKSLRLPPFQLRLARFDSSMQEVNFDRQMKDFKSQARVLLILARADITRKLLVAAAQNDMIGTGFELRLFDPAGVQNPLIGQVFIHLHPFTQLPGFPALYWRNQDSDDHWALQGFEALLILRFPTDRDVYDSNVLPEDTRHWIIDRSREEYNLTYGPNAKLAAPTIAAYEAVLVAGQIFNEIVEERDRVPLDFYMGDGSLVAKRFWNRTYTLPSGTIYFNENGERWPDMMLKQWNSTVQQFQTALIYDAEEDELLKARRSGIIWPGGKIPVNEPLCGFDGLKETCENNDSMRLFLVTTVVPLAVAILICGVVLNVIFRWRIVAADSKRWWKAAPEKLLPPHVSRPALATTATISSVRSHHAHSERTAVTHVNHCPTSLLNSPYSHDAQILANDQTATLYSPSRYALY